MGGKGPDRWSERRGRRNNGQLFVILCILDDSKHTLTILYLCFGLIRLEVWANRVRLRQ